MKLMMNIQIDDTNLASSIVRGSGDKDEILSFIMEIELEVGDTDFTEQLILRLAESLAKEDPDAVRALCSRIKDLA